MTTLARSLIKVSTGCYPRQSKVLIKALTMAVDLLPFFQHLEPKVVLKFVFCTAFSRSDPSWMPAMLEAYRTVGPLVASLFRINILLCIATLSPVIAQLLPDSQAHVLNELEHLYLDNPGPGSIKSTITPCTNYVDSSTGLNNNSLGRQSAAQWIRTAFRKAVF